MIYFDFNGIQKEEYMKFLNYIANVCDKVSFHIPCFEEDLELRKGIISKRYNKYSQNCKRITYKIENNCIERRISTEYGTSCYGYDTDVWIMELTDEIKQIIQESGSFMKWQYPDYPEDLCFYKKGSSKCWITTVAHEEEEPWCMFDETTEDINMLEELKISFEIVSGIMSVETPDYKEWGEVHNIQWEVTNQEATLAEMCQDGDYEQVCKWVNEKNCSEHMNDIFVALEEAIKYFDTDEKWRERYSIIKLFVEQGVPVDYVTDFGESLKEMIAGLSPYPWKSEYSIEREDCLFELYQFFYEKSKRHESIFEEMYSAALANNHKVLQFLLNNHKNLINKKLEGGMTILQDILEDYYEIGPRPEMRKTIDILKENGAQ